MFYLSRNFYLRLLLLFFGCSQATSSFKRGLCFTPNSTTPQDNKIWVQPPEALTWYYNYEMTPPPMFDEISQDQFEFVPMLWGPPTYAADTTFLEVIKSLRENGRNISHVMYVYCFESASRYD